MSALPAGAWLGAGVLSLLALLWSCRGAPLGVPVADDYTFLATLRFEHPLDFLGPMGSPVYWRPLSRQLYFLALGPRIMDAPWIPVLVHSTLLLALFAALFGIARRMLSPSLAALVAAFPLLGEPVRVLLGWPSGGEYLLAMLGCALAVHEALAGRRVTAALAATAAILSHEASTLLLVVLPAIGWFRTRQPRATLGWVALAALLAAVSWLGHSAAAARGMALPAQAAGFPWSKLPEVFAKAAVAQLGMEDAQGVRRTILTGAWITLAILAVALALRDRARQRVARAWHPLVGGALWFAAGIVPLAVLLPEWNGWRTAFPSLGLGLASIGTLALISPWIAGVASVLRLAALLSAPVAPTLVAAGPPPSASQMSFGRLARLQRTVESTRRALHAHYAQLPAHADVRYWWLPRLCEYGFQGSKAVRMWYGDSTMTWEKLGGVEGVESGYDAIVAYTDDVPWPATVVEPEGMRLYRQGRALFTARRYVEADSALQRATDVQPPGRGPFHGSVAILHGQVAYLLGDYARADSLARASVYLTAETPDYWSLEARLALARQDRDAAVRALRRCLAMEPTHPDGQYLAKSLGIIP